MSTNPRSRAASRTHWLFGGLAFLTAALWQSEALASGSWVPKEATFTPLGLNLGATWGGKDSGGLLGGELSVVQWLDGIWFGGYGDMLHDFGRDRNRLSLGGEFGYWIGGIDAGWVRDLGTGANGFRVRAIASLFFISAYAGGGALYKDNAHESLYEMGLLLKFPIFSREGNEGWGFTLR